LPALKCVLNACVSLLMQAFCFSAIEIVRSPRFSAASPPFCRTMVRRAAMTKRRVRDAIASPVA
jgi:hypothetical protein